MPSLLFAQSLPIKVAVFDSYQGHEHSDKVLSYLKKSTAKCVRCQFELFPIYSKKGDLLKADFLKGLQKIDKSYALVQISWNMKYDETFQGIVSELNRITQSGVVVVGASGESQDIDTITLPVDKTVLGQVSGIILVGELDLKGKLSSRSYYGPKIQAAFAAPEGFKGSSFSSLRLSSRILLKMFEGVKKDWNAHVLEVKKMSVKQWAELESF